MQSFRLWFENETSPDPRMVPRTQTFNGQNSAVGTYRIGGEGYVEKVMLVPPSKVIVPKENRMYAAKIDEYKPLIKSGAYTLPKVIRSSDGLFHLDDGAHRIAAARSLRVRKMPMWVGIQVNNWWFRPMTYNEIMKEYGDLDAAFNFPT